MNLFFTALACVIAFVHPTHARAPEGAERCLVACQEPYVSLKVTFTGAPKAAADQKCTNDLFVRSVYLCAREHCSEDEIEAGSDYVAEACEGKSYYNATTQRAANSVAVSQLSTMRQFRFEDKPRLVNTTMLPSEDLFQLSLRSVNAYYNGKDNHLTMAWIVETFWAVILAVGILYNAATSLYKAMSKPLSPQTSTLPLWRKIRAHIFLPATFKKACSATGPIGTVPPRIESVVIFSFFALNVIVLAVGYEVFPHNLYWGDETLQRWRYFTDRLGQVAFANVPLAWLFAMRNNPFIWLTGWSFATFNHFHRWVARILVLEALIHVLGRTVYNIQFNGIDSYHEAFLQQNWIAGAIATAAICLTLVVSNPIVRRKTYDVFLIFHQTFAVMILVALLYHVRKFNGQFDAWLWAAVGLWVFERVSRIIRMLAITGFGKGVQTTAELNDEANLVRVDISPAHFPFKAMRQGYLFLYSPFFLTFWQSHPFTLVRWKPVQAGENSSSPTSPSPDAAFEEKGIATATTMPVSDDVPYLYSLLINPTTGYTARLRRSLQQSTNPQKMRFMLEGPYSSSPDLGRFSDVCMFISGSGISVAISSVYEILEKNPGANVRMIWSVRSPALVDTIVERELAYALSKDYVKLEVFVTRGKDNPKSASMKSQVTFSRPDVPSLLSRAIAERAGSLAILVCGSASLTDDARKAFCTELSAQTCDMSLFVQSFNW